MYSRNFSRDRSAPPPPPSYSGVMYPCEEACAECAEQSAPSLPDTPCPKRSVPEKGEDLCESEEKRGLFDTLFARSLTFEDLLLVGLILLLIDSGADDELLILLAFLLLAGR